MEAKARAWGLVLVLVGMSSLCRPTQSTEVKNRCDVKTHITVRTDCKSCIFNERVNCSEGYIKLTNGSGARDCRYQFQLRTYSVYLPGCQHICWKQFLMPHCCPGYWGADCLACPGGAASPCSNRGVCSDGLEGNGTCTCEEGFGGTACETCSADNLYGENCRSVCDCIHGTCNNGIHGDGACDCFSGYSGSKCDEPEPACQALQCPENARCVKYSTGLTGCKCMPNYKGDGRTCEPINPCQNNVCDPKAGECTYLGPNQHKCSCRQGYKGDGIVCLPVDPCQENFGNCPTESSICKYDSPGKSHCECRKGYNNFVAGLGCSLIDVCETNNICSKKATCSTVSPGKTECVCKKGYVGDGVRCFGSILERMKDMNTEVGVWQGKLTSAISLFEGAYAWDLISRGPFTVLVPANKGFKATAVKKLLSDKEKAEYTAKLHIIVGQLDTGFLSNTTVIYTLTGRSAEVTLEEKESQVKIRIYGSKKKVSILQGNIMASNGLLHIIDKAIDDAEPTLEGNTMKSIMSILEENGRYNSFTSLLANSDVGRRLSRYYTIFAPSNTALDELQDNALEYLRSTEGSLKLQELLKYHIVPRTQISVSYIIPSNRVMTMASQFIHFNTSSNGQIQVNGINIVEADVAAENGRIYTLDGVLVPPSIIPILPHRCDLLKREMIMGSCANCALLYTSVCPRDSVSTDLFSHNCVYANKTSMSLILRYPRRGCARHCNATIKVPECCSGFYGPECLQCPGGFSNPCSGNGKCDDRINGTGLCMCNKGFKGTVCQYCYDLNRYGTNCDKKCACLHGRCDNRVQSDGRCMSGTCKIGYSGINCDTPIVPCGPQITFCHAHATCDFSSGAAKCLCKPGYEGDGTACTEVNACASSSGDGCNSNAECIQVGVGIHKCVCLQGWTGDGVDCSPINNCLSPSYGGCHPNAVCVSIGPGQNGCRCKDGFRGNGLQCEPINTCLAQSEKCHPLATCQLTSSGFWECACQEGYQGDGSLCFGNAMIELASIPEAAGFSEWVKTVPSIGAILSETINITVLVPSIQAINVMSQDDKAFWMSKENLPTLLKSHILKGVYSLDELRNSTAQMVAPLLPNSLLHLSIENGTFTIQGAHIIEGDIATTNGLLHIMDKVLAPLRSVSSPLPDLLTRLGQMPDYSIFRGYIIQYNLAKEIEAAEAYTIFAPNNNAIEKYSREKGTATLDEDLIRYHIVLGEQLLKNDLHIGMHRETMLGLSYQVGFVLHSDQIFVNDAPINYTNVATNIGVIHGIQKVMEILKNRCDNNDTVIVLGSCGSCSRYFLTSCPPGTESIEGLRKHCMYTEYRRLRRLVHFGCQQQCAQTIITRGCCAGFFGQQCLACPGKLDSPCFGNGVCMDNINGTGKCQCEEGFNGTACETCVKGKYGPGCNQECICVHGKCSEGTVGDGSCECDVGWRGIHCDSEITDDKCNRSCHTSANCLENPDGSAFCKCAAGFKGNGTVCTAKDACEDNNGGCSAYATCKRTSPGNRVCVCNPGYEGDGIVCLEINPCSVNNGGCHVNAECTKTGANQSVCNCFKGYSGDGMLCVPINPCKTVLYGGCSPFAKCNNTGPGERECTCKDRFVGDGFTCRGTIYEELLRIGNVSQFFYKMQAASMRELAGAGPYTAFVPSSEAMKREPELREWILKGVLAQVLRYHIVGCDQLLRSELMGMTSVRTLQGDSIKITHSQSQNSTYLNGANIISSDVICLNGIIHVIDRVLVPPSLIVPKKISYSVRENLTTLAEKHGYATFSKLLQDMDLLSLINDPIHKPVTLFWPSDKTIKALPQEQQDFLFNPQNKDKLIDYLKYHIIRDEKILANDLPYTATLKTLQGSDLSVKCGDKDNVGDLLMNDRQCKIVQRDMDFDSGIAYGIDCLLTPPSLGGRCDSLVTLDILGQCSYCFATPSCPAGSKYKGTMQKCPYNNSYRSNINGCRKECGILTWITKCCKGYFGKDCQACPGGPESPCNSRGVCDDGVTRTGECTCNRGFNGTSCELCLLGRFGPECKSCSCTDHGQCDEGINGSGDCTCDSGWGGNNCETKLDVLPVCSPACSSNAICKENNTCLCKPFYEGDGIKCTVVDLCKQNNGGCAMSSKCSQTGVKVSCSCQKGYKGDGYICLPIDPCADGLNGGCHEHAICKMTGPDKRVCECKDNYIGDGVYCEVKTLPIDRCSQDNGQCHIDADCADLHYQDATVGVFHLRSPKGQYKWTYDEATKACADEDATIATYNQLLYAQKAGYHLCSAGWLDKVRVGYPTAFSSQNCGSGQVGIVDYGPRVNVSENWDVFCYRVKDVNCTCKVGYVGDGYTCRGNLLQVLMSFPMFSNFLWEIITYSHSSSQGREFLSYLTNLSIQATMFAPNNDVMNENETLSGRDIEYHLSNVGTFFYEDLTNGSTLQTRIGNRLLITFNTDQDPMATTSTNETRFVDGRAIIQWDLFASNGIIHIISGPLRAPPVPVAAVHPGAGAGIFFIILTVIGLVAFAGYSFHKFRKGQIRFQKFTSNENISVSALDKSSLSNPMYESSTTSVASPSEPTYDAFSDSDEQQLVTDKPHE
ncbi:hypothetical protein NDU88_004066 [Pleurodeles waltl]|uniref:Stabilin-2 n=1 Tax=Pleurodeles waltl TaxID=8319 RepID=A0AAV7SHR4_PLEWA|nr:hypothetical protein NDU88_004066 [Pleurodeles waltl]